MKSGVKRTTPYKVISIIILVILAILFLFPLYWIVTGAFKPTTDIYASQPVWWPSEWVTSNFEKLFTKRSAPLFEIGALVGPTVYGTDCLRFYYNALGLLFEAGYCG